MRHTAKLITILTALIAAISIYKIKNVDDVKRITPDLVKFAKWIKEHKKTYNTPNEYIYRFGLFQQTLRKIQAHKQKNDALYTVGLNQFSDLSKKEFLTKYTGLRFSDKRKNVQYINTLAQTPGVDWRTKGAVNAIKNQGQCGSCWAFSTIAALEAAHAIAGNPLVSLSEQQLVDCSTSFGNHGCNGGWMDYAFEYIKSKGSELESVYPYTARDGSCKFNAQKVITKDTGYVDVPKNNNQQLVNAVQKTVVSVAIDAYGIMSYNSGIFNGECGTALNHGVAAVGFGTQQGTDFWIVRNSWGTSWGEEGYFRMVRQTGAGKCGINMAASYPTV